MKKTAKERFRERVSKIRRSSLDFADISVGIAVRIQDILRIRNITQRDLAAKLGKNESEISKYLSGDHNFTIDTISKIQEALDEQILYTDTDVEIRQKEAVQNYITSSRSEEIILIKAALTEEHFSSVDYEDYKIIPTLGIRPSGRGLFSVKQSFHINSGREVVYGE